MEWSYLSRSQIQRLHHWRLGLGKWFHSTSYKLCNHLFMVAISMLVKLVPVIHKFTNMFNNLYGCCSSTDVKYAYTFIWQSHGKIHRQSYIRHVLNCSSWPNKTGIWFQINWLQYQYIPINATLLACVKQFIQWNNWRRNVDEKLCLFISSVALLEPFDVHWNIVLIVPYQCGIDCCHAHVYIQAIDSAAGWQFLDWNPS